MIFLSDLLEFFVFTELLVLENSLLYAQKAKFNAVSGKKEQIGTITYIFQSKR